MTTVDYTCRLCGRPGSVEVPSEYDPKMHGSWVKMLCHEFCYQIRNERIKCEERIARGCQLAERLDALDDTERGTMTRRLRDIFEISTKQWAKNECKALGSHAYYWNHEIVDALMDKPASWHAILRNSRNFIKQQCEENNDKTTT